MATWTIEAVFQNGVFRPIMPVALPDNTCATVVVESAVAPRRVMAPFGEMDESDWTWMAWAGSLGATVSLGPIEQDEG